MTTLETIPEIIRLARRSGLESVADRLDYLYKLDVDNGDEPMNSDTVSMLVLFMIEHPDMVTDMITVNPDGFVHATWDITQSSRLDARFLPSGNVWFAYTVDDSDSDRFKILKKGEVSPNDMLKEVMPFIERST